MKLTTWSTRWPKVVDWTLLGCLSSTNGTQASGEGIQSMRLPSNRQTWRQWHGWGIMGVVIVAMAMNEDVVNVTMSMNAATMAIPEGIVAMAANGGIVHGNR